MTPEERLNQVRYWPFVEWGFKCAEKGWNLEKTYEEFDKLWANIGAKEIKGHD